MRKSLVFLVVIFATLLFEQNTNAKAPGSLNLNFSVTVEQSIEMTSIPLAFSFGVTKHSIAGVSHEELYGEINQFPIAYVNCPFTVAISGTNGLGQEVPRLARQETGVKGGSWDYLPTSFAINLTTNGVYNDNSGIAPGKSGDHRQDNGNGSQSFVNNQSHNNPGNNFQVAAASSFPRGEIHEESPLNGLVNMDLKVWVNTYGNIDNVPLRATQINASQRNNQSADAGQYECTLIVTFMAL